VYLELVGEQLLERPMEFEVLVPHLVRVRVRG